jgi:hypothetical protein
MFGRLRRTEAKLDNIETAFDMIGTAWVVADHETKLAAGQLMIETLQRIIFDYDFSRYIKVQFFAFVDNVSRDLRAESARHFTEIAASAKTANPALYIVTGYIGQFFVLFALMDATNNAKKRKAMGELFSAHCVTANDIIQYTLYHRAIANT